MYGLVVGGSNRHVIITITLSVASREPGCHEGRDEVNGDCRRRRHMSKRAAAASAQLQVCDAECSQDAWKVESAPDGATMHKKEGAYRTAARNANMSAAQHQKRKERSHQSPRGVAAPHNPREGAGTRNRRREGARAHNRRRGGARTPEHGTEWYRTPEPIVKDSWRKRSTDESLKSSYAPTCSGAGPSTALMRVQKDLRF